MSASAVLLRQLDDRRSILIAHLEILREACERGDSVDPVQLDLLASEMLFLRSLYGLLELDVIARKVLADA